MITGGADTTVVDRAGKPVLAAEAKSRFDVSSSWAAGTFRNLYAHGSVPDVPFFLLALPDTFYLWKHPRRKADQAFMEGRRSALGETEVEPDHAVPAWEIVRPHLGRPGGRDPDPREVGSYAMRMALDAFLADVLNARNLTRETAPPNLRWLFESGLYEAMRGGSFAGAVAG